MRPTIEVLTGLSSPELVGEIMITTFFFFWLHRVACGILVPGPGIEPAPPALEAQSLHHWTAREVP